MTNTPAISLCTWIVRAGCGSEMAMMADGAVMRGIARYGKAAMATRSDKA
jgi:hypothetical protein